MVVTIILATIMIASYTDNKEIFFIIYDSRKKLMIIIITVHYSVNIVNIFRHFLMLIIFVRFYYFTFLP